MMKTNTFLVISLGFMVFSLENGVVRTSHVEQNGTVKRNLGMENGKAFVGFLFSYKIPDEAFTGNIIEYKVSEACEDTLPTWLTFDPTSRTFSGLPQPPDVGLFYICVKAGGISASNGTTSFAKDVFSIDVAVGLTPSFVCSKEESVVLGTIHIDASLTGLPKPEPFRILQTAGRALGISADQIRLTPLIKRYDSSKNPILLSGNEVSFIKPKNQGARIQFQVGCSGDTITNGNRLTNYLEQNSTIAELSRILKHAVIDWEIRSGFPLGHIPPIDGLAACSKHWEDIKAKENDALNRSKESTLNSSITVIAISPACSEQLTKAENNQTGGNISTTAAGTQTLNCTKDEHSTFVTVVNEFILDSNATHPVVSPAQNQTPTNFEPLIFKRLERFALTAGKAWRYQIPEDTFSDFEDGNTRNLKLTLTTEDQTVSFTESWIHFDEQNQVLSALPFEEHIGKYEFVLKATDSEGSSVMEQMGIYVRQNLAARRFNHEFVMTLGSNARQRVVNVSWQIDMLKRISQMFGDDDSSSISLKFITLSPVRVVWVNDSMAMSYCPKNEIRKIYSTMASESGSPKKEFKELMLPEFVQKVELKFSSSCDHLGDPDPGKGLSFAPILRNPIDYIHISVGDILTFKIPEDTFYDPEDMGSLHLRLLNSDGSDLPESSWIQFDSTSQEIYGVAGEQNFGRKEYMLTATDSTGLSASDVFVLNTDFPLKRRNPPVKFSVNIDEDFEALTTWRKILFATKISHLYGDDSTEHIMITSINNGSGSVVFTWSNKTLLREHCPMNKIHELSKLLVNDNGSPSAALIQAMGSEFGVISVNVIVAPGCTTNPRNSENKKTLAPSKVRMPPLPRIGGR